MTMATRFGLSASSALRFLWLTAPPCAGEGRRVRAGPRVDVDFDVQVSSSFSVTSTGRRRNRPKRAHLVPVADLDVVRRRIAVPDFDQLLEAHQVDGPLGAAVVHELH